MSDEQEVRKGLKIFDGIWFFQAKLLKLYHSVWHRDCSASTWFLRSTERQWPQPSNNNSSKQLRTAFFFQNPPWESKIPQMHCWCLHTPQGLTAWFCRGSGTSSLDFVHLVRPSVPSPPAAAPSAEPRWQRSAETRCWSAAQPGSPRGFGHCPCRTRTVRELGMHTGSSGMAYEIPNLIWNRK